MPLSDHSLVREEIAENRALLRDLTTSHLDHFCYPSGEYDLRVLGLLRSLGVRSATTCKAGFNYPGDDPLQLRRFLDGENVSEIEFEAELSGAFEIARHVRSAVRRFRLSASSVADWRRRA
jgi:peptidoglycan/xylan/chitin deacetylase (PgdA/CDA1 family)